MSLIDEVLNIINYHGIEDIRDILEILDASFDGIALSDENGFIFYVNQAFERITGIDRMDFIGRKPTEYKQMGLIIKAAKIVGNNGVSNVIQISKHKITGESMVFLISTLPVCYKGKIIYYSNFRESNTLSNVQMELLAETNKVTDFEFTEGIKELFNIFSSKDIIVKSAGMLNIIKTASKIAKTDITVNISGESGVGKDVIAKLIHSMSKRKGEPFIQINCGSIPDHLLESELFGYIGGSFTGASKSGRVGLLESANGGAVFLDEIGDLPMSLQSKILRVLNDKEMYPIGGRKPIKLDLRFICATNKNLIQMVRDGTFREDLYFRINMVPLHIPPLRNRTEDIFHLCQLFLKKNNQKYETNKTFSPEVYTILDHYNWPGNVRELKHLIERLVIVTESNRIEVNDLPSTLLNKTNIHKIPAIVSNLKMTMDELEKNIILEAVKTHGCKKAAQVLKINYSTLKRKKKKFNLN